MLLAASNDASPTKLESAESSPRPLPAANARFPDKKMELST